MTTSFATASRRVTTVEVLHLFRCSTHTHSQYISLTHTQHTHTQYTSPTHIHSTHTHTLWQKHSHTHSIQFIHTQHTTQPWSPPLLRGRRGTWCTPKGSDVRPGVPPVSLGLRHFCVAGVALGALSIGRMYALASHPWSPLLLRGRRGTWCTPKGHDDLDHDDLTITIAITITTTSTSTITFTITISMVIIAFFITSSRIFFLNLTCIFFYYTMSFSFFSSFSPQLCVGFLFLILYPGSLPRRAASRRPPSHIIQ